MLSDEISPEMLLFSPDGERLYLTGRSVSDFYPLPITKNPKKDRMFCYTLHKRGKGLESPLSQIRKAPDG